MIGVELFAGAGGMALGAQQAGIDVKIAVEIDRHAAATYKHNHPRVKLLMQDVREVTPSDLPKTKQPKILFGGPPCQGFSTSNQRTRNGRNENNWLFIEFMRIAEIWEPDWIVFENVKGIVETEGGMFLTEIKKLAQKLGYTISDWILDAADFGVPQRRNRYFLIGSREGSHIPKPSPTVDRSITVWDAISDLPPLLNGAMEEQLPYQSEANSAYAQSLRNGQKYSLNNFVTLNSSIVIERYKHIPEGGNWADIPEHLMHNYTDLTRCHTRIYHRLFADKPSVVLGHYRKNMLIHPTENRGLSVREAARLQSFSDNYVFKGSIGYQQQQVGNAVPPLLAKHVFKLLIRTF